ncbi:MAG: hypothetical protein II342_00070 [Clostridia bacterium]|nr:hypothetical protein [Clostridia bacterium]
MLKNKSLLISGISLIITIVMMVTLCSVGFTASATTGEEIEYWDGQVATSFAGGTGAKNDPFIIENGGQLYKMVKDYTIYKEADVASVEPKYFKITKDIYLNNISAEHLVTDDYTLWGKAGYKAWCYAPKDQSTGFSGIIDGAGHTVYGVYHDGTSGNTTTSGFIPNVVGKVEISNLTVKNSIAYGQVAGVMVGLVNGKGTTLKITNCSVDNSCSRGWGSSTRVGGFVGGAYADSASKHNYITIENCSATNMKLILSGGTHSGMIGLAHGTKSGDYVIKNCFTDETAYPSTYKNTDHYFDLFSKNVKYENVYTSSTKIRDYTGIIHLEASKMKGEAAQTNMPNLDWSVWETTENGYPVLKAPVAPEVPECEHETTKDAIIEEATYFKAGLKNIVCADEACGAMVETDVVIPAAEAALNGDFTETFADGKLTISWTYSDALALDILDGAKISFNYSINGYTKAVELSGETGETVILEGFNADRLNADLTYNLSAVYADVDTAKLNAVGGAVKTADIANDEKLDALLEALEADAVVNGTVANSEWLVSNTAKLDLKAAKAELNVAASQELIDALAAKGGRTDRAVKLIVKIGDNITKEIEINDLRKYTIVTISGLSFEQLNGDISVQLVFDYANDEYDFATDEIVFACGDMIANANTTAADAFVAYMN